MRSVLRDCVLIGIFATVVFFTNLGGPRLWDRDEPRNAGCAREMLQRNDWVTPVFNAELRTHKPVLTYWLMMTGYAMFGVGEFGARFWSAALAVGTVLCTYAIGRRMFDRRVGIWAGIIVSTCLMFDVAARAATPDSPLMFFSTLALTVYVLAVFPKSSSASEEHGSSVAPSNSLTGGWYPRSWWVVTLLFAVTGVAVLAKGPVGIVLPTAVIGMFLLIQNAPPARRRRAWMPRWVHPIISPLRVFRPMHFLRTCWMMRPVTAIVVCLAVALPWYYLVGIRTDGAFLRGFFLEHNLGRAATAMEGHNGSLLFYPVAILIGFFPWSVFSVPVILETVHRIRSRDSSAAGYRFAACWIGVYIGAFSVAQTKLPSYVTPCYPALALLTGCYFHRWSKSMLPVARFWQQAALVVYCVVGIIIVTALPFVIRQALPNEEWLAAFGLIPVLGGALALYWLRKGRSSAARVTFATSATAFVLALFAVGASRVDQHQENHRILQAIEQRGDGVPVASYCCLEPTWVFYGNHPIDEVTSHQASWVEQNGSWTFEKPTGVAPFLEKSPDGCFITTDEHLAELKAQLPTNFDVVVDVPYFLRKRRLLLVAPRNLPTKTAGGTLNNPIR